MEELSKLNGLIGQDLTNFKIVEMTHVYLMDYDGHFVKSIGYFKDPVIAEAFRGAQVDANFMRKVYALVLTDGQVGYDISQNQVPIKLFNDEQEAVDLKNRALAKLTLEDRKLLGLE